MTKNKNSGFTLVELAIVLVIVGLLVGGVLQGQELIKQAQLRNVLSQIREYDTAVNTFRAKYDNAIPGDFDKATQFGIGQNLLPEDSGNFDPALTDGNNNGQLESYPAGGQQHFLWEFKNFFVMLSNAGLVKGTYSQATPNTTAGVAFPKLATGGGMIVVSVKNGLYYLLAADSKSSIFDVSLDEGTTGFLTAILTPEQAHSIDSKLDDGQPNTGGTQTFWSYNGSNNPTPFTQNNVFTTCGTTDVIGDPTSVYRLDVKGKVCFIYVKASS